MFDKLMYNTSKIEFTKDSNLFLIDRLIIKGYRSSVVTNRVTVVRVQFQVHMWLLVFLSHNTFTLLPFDCK